MASITRNVNSKRQTDRGEKDSEKTRLDKMLKNLCV